MNGEELHHYMENYRQLEDSLASTVKISHEQVCILVVKDLISKRNSQPNKITDDFDSVLRYYLTDDEFKRFVIHGEDVK